MLLLLLTGKDVDTQAGKCSPTMTCHWQGKSIEINYVLSTGFVQRQHEVSTKFMGDQKHDVT